MTSPQTHGANTEPPVTEGPIAIKVGDLYEDCAYRPVLCTHTDPDGTLQGISLLDGSGPRSCDLNHCGVLPLTIADVLEARENLDAYIDARQHAWDGTTPKLA